VAVAVAVAVGTGVKVLVWVGGTGVSVTVGVSVGENETPQAESAAEANIMPTVTNFAFFLKQKTAICDREGYKHRLIILGENNFIMARSLSFWFQTIQPRL
jgi:hypothetical protein